MTNIELKNIIDETIKYKNFAQDVIVVSETKQGASSMYKVQTSSGVTFHNVPGFPGIKSTGIMGFVLGDKSRPVMVGGAAAVERTVVTIASTPWTDVVDLTPPITRALFGGGVTTGPTVTYDIIDYVTIATTGNAIDFGDLSEARYGLAASSSASRGLFVGGVNGAVQVDTIDYVEIASFANAADFGNLSEGDWKLASTSNSSRALIGGIGFNHDLIEYVTISTLSDTIPFGTLSVGRHSLGAASSESRALFAGGDDNGEEEATDTIDYVTFASLSTAQDFGNLPFLRTNVVGTGSFTRALFAGGEFWDTEEEELDTSDSIEYVTIASLSNTVDFGDLSALGLLTLAASSSQTRALFSLFDETIEYVTIATTGNTTDFGDLTVARSFSASCSGVG